MLFKSSALYETAKETLMYRTGLWTLWERERVARFGRMALKHVKCHVWNEMPVQVQCAMLDAWDWCTGMTQRDGIGREEGGGFRMDFLVVMYGCESWTIIYETICQSRFDALFWMLGASALGRPRGMEWGGRREEGSGWGTHVYLWRIAHGLLKIDSGYGEKS